MKNNLKKGYLENARKKFLFLGLTITCSMALVAFKVSSYEFEEVKTSKISVPDDDTVIFFELPKRSPAKQKAASKAVNLSTERYKITKVIPEIKMAVVKLDLSKLSLEKLGNSDELFGEEEIKEDIVDPNILVDWSRLERTPYYDDCVNVGLTADVYVSFVIDKKGNVQDVEALNDNVHKDFIKAAIKGVESLPQMNPGTQRMRPVSVKLTIPVIFNLN